MASGLDSDRPEALDPFATPQAKDSAERLEIDADAATPYREPRRGVVAALGACAALGVVNIFALVNQIRAINLPNASLEVLQQSDQIIGSVALLSVVAFFTTVVLWGTWVYRAAANLRAMRPDGFFEFTPASQFWWYFVPFANLVQPFKGMREIFTVSHAAVDRPPPSRLGLNAWWGAYLLGNFMGNISIWLIPDADLLQGAAYFSRLSVASVVDICSEVVSILAAVVAIQLILQINALQTEWRRAGGA